MPTIENTTVRIRHFYISEIESIQLYPGYNIITDKQYEKFIKHPAAQVAYDCNELKDVSINETKIEKSLDGLDIIHNSDGEPVPVKGFSNDPLYQDEEAIKKSEEYLDSLEENEQINEASVNPISDDITQHIRLNGAQLKKLGFGIASATKIIKSQPTDGYSKESLLVVVKNLDDNIDVTSLFA
jgi:hypothetical protein